VSRRRGITPAVVRRLALALPEVIESSHFDVPDFRVRNKIFATLPKEGRVVVLKTTPANLDALVRADAATFSDEWRGRWLGVRLDRISLPMLRDLLVDSWRLAAPKRLATTLTSSVRTRSVTR
jgi:hypothetical protein